MFFILCIQGLALINGTQLITALGVEGNTHCIYIQMRNGAFILKTCSTKVADSTQFYEGPNFLCGPGLNVSQL